MLIPSFRLAVLLCVPLLVVGIGMGMQGSPDFGESVTHAPHAEHPPLAHTGGFGEPTCHECHFGGELNGGDGTLSVEGLPTSVHPGRSYRVSVRLSAEMRRAGFMLSVRGTDGRQVGSLASVDTVRTAVHTIDSTGVQYVHHTLRGTNLSTRGRAEWRLRWTAPPTAGDSVVVHVAANAANDDASEFGDDIYTTQLRTRVSAAE